MAVVPELLRAETGRAEGEFRSVKAGCSVGEAARKGFSDACTAGKSESPEVRASGAELV